MNVSSGTERQVPQLCCRRRRDLGHLWKNLSTLWNTLRLSLDRSKGYVTPKLCLGRRDATDLTQPTNNGARPVDPMSHKHALLKHDSVQGDGRPLHADGNDG